MRTSKMAQAKLIVFDLDYTLWPFWVDTHVTPPFKKGTLIFNIKSLVLILNRNIVVFINFSRNGDIVDAYDEKIRCYPQAPQVLNKLHVEGYVLGVASRTSEIEGANQLLKLFDWEKYFTYKEIYPGCKITHFTRIQSKSGIDFNKMIFFDDEHRNIHDLNYKGVVSILVKNGITDKVINEGLMEFSQKRSSK
ncbi:magnesium-dependent phosphatase 1 mdp1 [Holotrichia oblita]|uniref:Magnesium-dependent phosphatase 1 mdp1 n=1 Tax=Holotrichia oblita TaxID=644536 RepID=A0ACB9TYR0_HOLOL|nr:magnesium-dependent phosphatase 1 mdp1 [Holotrichia oblita]